MININLNFTELCLSLQPDVQLRRGLYQNIAFYRQLIYIEHSKLNITDMWLILLDRVISYQMYPNITNR